MSTNPSRPFDSFYDPIYTSPAGRTVPEFTNKVILPHYPNMFSEGQNFQAKSIQMRTQPFNITAVNDGNYLVRPIEVGGTDRFRYFRRPLVPFLPTFVVNRPETAAKPRSMNAAAVARHQRQQQQQRQDQHQHHQSKKKQASGTTRKTRDGLVEIQASEDVRTVGIQTLYRESEAQTLPFSPPYVIGKLQPKGTVPELVRLGHLIWGNGLPVTMDELDLIEREQTKRHWFESLPPLAEGEDDTERKAERARREAEDWAFRENQIKRLQDERLELVKQVIREKNARLQEWHHTRIDRAWQTKLQEREAVRAKIDKQRQKLLKVLADRRAKFGPQNNRRDIIAEHDNVKDLSRIAVRGPIEIRMTVGEKDLQQALANLPIRDLRTDNAGKQPEDWNKHSTSAIDERNWNKTINKIHDTMTADKSNQGQPETLRLLKRVEKPPVRPKTPEIERIDPGEDRLNKAALLLQRLMRGRVVQNAMHEGKSRRLDLINELRYRDALASSISLGSLAVLSGRSAQDLSESGAAITASQQQQQQQIFDSDNLATLFEAHVQSEYIGKRLHFLTHQLTRLREMRRIDALVALAERTRDAKESMEIDRREKELADKAQRDLIWREVMGVHSETVDSFLEAAVLDGIKDVSSDVARERVWEDVRKTKAIMETMGSAKEQVDEEQVVRDLMAAFLLPEVDRETVRKQLEQQQAKYLNAAKQTIGKLFE